MAKELDVSRSTVRHFLRKYRLKTHSRRPYYKKERMQQYYDALILRLHNYSYSKIGRMIGVDWRLVGQWAKHLPENKEIARQNLQAARQKSLDEVTGKNAIRKKLIELRGYRCEECQRTMWQERPIPVHVHHIDGNKKNNRLGNLKILCLNCHGLTDNFCAKNRKSKRS